MALKPLQQFMGIVKDYNLWKTFEVKSCLFREKETSQWKAGFIYIQLREDTPYAATGINTSRLKLIHQVKDIKYLRDILNRISSRGRIRLANEFVSLELLTGEILFDYHQRRNAVELYDIDSFCYELIKGGKQPEGFGELIRGFELLLRKNNPPFENLKDACKSILGIDFGTSAYYPFMRIVGPILVNIDTIDFSEKNISIVLNCSSRVDIDDLEANVFGKDALGNTTDLRKKVKFARKKDSSKVYSSIPLTGLEAESSFINVILSYKGQEIEDKGQKKSESNGIQGQIGENRLKASGIENGTNFTGTSFRNLELNIFKYDFAISFARENRNIAERLHGLLKH